MQPGSRRKGRSPSTQSLSRLARAVSRSLPWTNRSTAHSAASARLGLERLEDRRLLATDLIINEFIASSSEVPPPNTFIPYRDPAFPGESPDWIELYNPKETAQPLVGWKLRDSNQTWAFPNGASIPARGYLVVFADSKNLTNPTQPLHTNFNLSDNGEYLGLLRPDNSIAHEYAPSYPAQDSNISYGMITQSITQPLITPNTTMKGIVPTNGSLGTSWNGSDPNFSDAGWASGTRGIGYETETAPPAPAPGWTVRMLDTATGSIDHIGEATALLNGNLSGFTLASPNGDTSHVIPNINYVEGGRYGPPTSPNQNLPNGATPATSNLHATREQYALRATTWVTIPAGTYTIGVNSNEGFQLTFGEPGTTPITFQSRVNENTVFSGPSAANQLTFSAPRGSNDTLGTFTVPAGGMGPVKLTLDMFEATGGDNFEVFLASGLRTSWSAANFSLLQEGTLGWQVKSAPPSTVYTGMFGIDVKNPMLNQNGSAYLRATFPLSLEDVDDFTKLTLGMKYDDGFVAYINGQKVAERNAPGAAAWNSNATADRADNLAVISEFIDIPVTAGLLRTGDNVLAIQGLNFANGDPDFLALPTLEGTTVPVEVQRYFGTPTPNAANTNSFVGRVSDTKFSHDRGFYTAPFLLKITTDTNDAVVRYTTNGSTPTANSPAFPAAGLTIDRTTTLRAVAMRPGYLPTNVDTQTYIFVNDVVQQSPFGQAPAGWPTSWSPNTTDYGMDPDIVNHPVYGATLKNDLRTIPTLSIVTDLPNLFDIDGSRGIYSHPDDAGIGAERPASLELINPDGSQGFQVNAGLRLRGGYSRSTGNPKHGLRFLFRPEYGDSQLEYDLFKNQNGTDTFDGFDLRTFQNYSWSFDPSGSPGFGIPNTGGGSRFVAVRDQFSRDTQYDMGWNAERGDYYHLYINGQYWGLYNSAERPEASYAASYFGGEKEDYDVIKVDPQLGYDIEATDGNMDGWFQFWQKANEVRSLGQAGTPAAIQAANNKLRELMGLDSNGVRNPSLPVYLDPKNLIDYMLIIYYGGNLDAPISGFIGNNQPNNWYGIWDRKNKDMGFQFFSHDAEHTLLDAGQNRLGPFIAGDPSGSGFLESNPQQIFQVLLYSPEFRVMVQDQIHKHLFNNGALTTQAATARMNKRRDEIVRAINAESARWGDSKGGPYTWDTWNNNFNSMMTSFITPRTDNLIRINTQQPLLEGQFRQHVMGTAGGTSFSLYPRGNQFLEAPEFDHQFGGTFRPGQFQMRLLRPSGQGTIYYTLDGTDPRMWGGGTHSGAQVYSGPVSLSDTALVTARVLNNGQWSPLTQALFVNETPPGVRVSEVMYNPAEPPVGSQYTPSEFEYVEVQNITSGPLNLKDYKFTRGIDFTFPNLVLGPGERTVVVANLAAFQSRYGAGIPIAGVFTGHLSNGGEGVTLTGRFGETVQQFSYNDNWHPHTDGDGFSLVATSPTQDVNLFGEKEGWRASAAAGGDPGSSVASLNPRSIAINEIAANVATPNTTWIELKNTTNQAIDISGWFLSNDLNNPKKYKFAPGTVIQPAGQPGSILLLNEQTSYGLGANAFTLDKHGGDVYLVQADASENLLGYREIQDYNETDVGKTHGRYVKNNGAQDYPILSSPTPGTENTAPQVGPVVINEIMYSPSGNNAVEWIEIRNISNQAVQLFDPANPANTWKFTDGVEFTFPQGVTLNPLEFALIVPIEPSAFRAQYNLPTSLKIYGPYTGFLDNTGETVRLSRPGVPYQQVTPGGTVTVVPNIHVDRVNFNNTAPWPSLPDGTGPSLIRKISAEYGNDPVNWTSSPQTGGSPGVINVNTPPAVVLGPPVTLNEGDTFTSGGSFTDVDFGQTHTAEVNWGDFGANEPLTLNPDGTFSLNHVFTDDGTYNVRVRVIDSGQSFTDKFVLVTVNNVAPTATLGFLGAATMNEGGSKQVRFTNQTDPSLRDRQTGFTYSYDWNNDGTFEVNNTSSSFMVVPASITADGPKVQTIRARILDKNGGFTDYTVVLTVNNAVPAVDPIEDANLPAPGVFNYLGTFFDPSELDTHTGTVDWNYHPGDNDAEPLTINPDYSFDLAHNFTSGGTYVVRVVVIDDDGGQGVQTFTVTVPGGGDTTPPTVTQANFQYLTGPRSISMTFSEDVGASLGADDLAVLNQTTSTPVSPGDISFAWNAQTLTGTWTINVPLTDGNYGATLVSTGVEDAAGNDLDGDGVGGAGGNFVLPFFFMSGDADHDRDVDFQDLVALAQNYNQSGKTFAQGDFDGDGTVGFPDLVALAQRYGTSLPAAGAAAGEALAAQTAQPLPVNLGEFIKDPVGTLNKLPPVGPVKRPAPVSKPVAKVTAKDPAPAKAAATARTAATVAVPVTAFSNKRISAKPVKRANDLFV